MTLTADPGMDKYDWSRLTSLQVGRYAEYYAKMEFTLYGFDVYTTEVDDKGIDFVIRKKQHTFFEIQVKSTRGFNYIFLPKHKFDIDDHLFVLVIVFFPRQPPNLFLVPSTAWQSPNALFVSRDYVGLKSKPEWGINLNQKTYPLLQKYRFDTIIRTL